MADHVLFAAAYDWVMAPLEWARLAERRQRLLAQARGRVLEVGGGTGANLPLYSNVESVVVLEPDGAMARRMLPRLASAAVPVEVHEAGIDDHGLAGSAFDTVVSTLTFCSVPDLSRALAQVSHLLVPGGRLLFLEHVLGVGTRARIQRVAAPAWARLAAGCRPDRDIVGAVRDAGMSVTDLDRFSMMPANPVLGPAVAGIATPSVAAG